MVFSAPARPPFYDEGAQNPELGPPAGGSPGPGLPLITVPPETSLLPESGWASAEGV